MGGAVAAADERASLPCTDESVPPFYSILLENLTYHTTTWKSKANERQSFPFDFIVGMAVSPQLCVSLKVYGASPAPLPTSQPILGAHWSLTVSIANGQCPYRLGHI